MTGSLEVAAAICEKVAKECAEGEGTITGSIARNVAMTCARRIREAGRPQPMDSMRLLGLQVVLDERVPLNEIWLAKHHESKDRLRAVVELFSHLRGAQP